MATQLTATAVGADLIAPLQSTLADVLKDPVINEEFGGRDRKLSQAQAGLAAAVTVKMQDRLRQQIEQSHQRELNLIAGFWKLYRTPVFQSRTTASQTSDSAKADKGEKSSFGDLFSWGNLIGGAAVVIVAAAFYYTKMTANYESLWKAAEDQTKSLGLKLESEQKANEALQVELAKAQTRADASQEALKAATGSAADVQQKLIQTISELGQQKGDLAKQVAASTGEKKFQSLYDAAQREIRDLREKNAQLQAKVARQEEQLKSK
jgi:hypothetical protein